MMLDKYGNEVNWMPNLDSESRAPMYLKIVDAIKNDIKCGVLMRGFKMPPQRVLAHQLGVNHGTITRAYKICEEKGLVKGIVGKGTFIAASPGLPVSLLTDHQDTEVISLGLAISLYEANSIIESEVKAVLEAMDYGLTLKYSPPEGHIKHRYIAANWLEEYKIQPQPNNLLITSGTQNALSIILITLFQKGDRIVVDEYTYTGLRSLAAYMGIILVPVSGGRNGMDLDELRAVCKREQPKGMYLISDYQNPTTITLSLKKREKIAEVIQENRMLLLEDATFSFSMKKKIAPVSSLIPERSFYILGTSKAISPAFRISYVVSPAEYVNTLKIGLNNIIWMASPYTSEIVSLLQSTGAYSRIVQEKIRLLGERNRLFDEIMAGYDVLDSETSCYRFLMLPKPFDDGELERIALERGVQLFSANRFYVGAKPQNCTIRLAISTPDTIDELRKALIIVRETLEYCRNMPRVFPVV